MPSSIFNSKRLTASDRPGVAQPVPVRDVPPQRWGSIILGAIVIAVILSGGWEWYWRDFGAVPGYRDDDALWARQRRRIDEGEGDATVLIGASRTLFDTQLQIWERLSGRRPIQLALNGTSPLFALEDLADDSRFTGRLLIGIAPDVFFSGFQYHKGLLRYLHKESPSQRAGKYLSMRVLEPYLAFYDPDFALFPVIRRLPWPERAGLGRIGVRKLDVMGADRNDHMWDKLPKDPEYAALAAKIWAQDFDPPTEAEAIEADRTAGEQIDRAAVAVAKLRARGVPVIFVRDPSGGAYLSYEERDLPREKTWDVLLRKVQAEGIHFLDYPELHEGYDLPEGSHMTQDSAERYTVALYTIIQRDHAPPGGGRW